MPVDLTYRLPWVRSSSSVPGIGPPVLADGDLLIDGDVLNNLPADVMRSRGSGHVAAVDVSPKVEMTIAKGTRAEMSGWAELARRLNRWSGARPAPSIFEILTRTASMSSIYLKQQVRDTADLLLNPPIEKIGVLDWGAIEQAVEIGYRHASPNIERWIASREASA